MDENDQLREEISTALSRIEGMDATKLSRGIGRSKDFVRDFLSGRKKSIAQDAAQQIRDLLNKDRLPAAPEHGIPANYRPPPQFLGERDLPVYSAVEGGPGAMVVNTEPIMMVQRPWYLADVKGYGVVVTGESMVPVYEPGDIVIVNPRLPAIRNKNAIFTTDWETGSFKATVKRLERALSDRWKVRQWNPPDSDPQEFDLLKADWPNALRIVGKYEG